MGVNGIQTRPDSRVALIALIPLGLAALMAVMDGTVVAVALNPLAAGLDAPLDTIVWVTIGYLLAMASMLPLLGWATARFGGRSVFLTGLALFVLGSTLAAFAWSAGSLIAFRVLQGAGGGMLEPTSLALAAALAGPETVGRVIGTMSMIINIAPILGPLVGGLLLSTGHWQWIFITNIPLGIIVLVAALMLISSDRPDPAPDAETTRAAAVRPVADVRGLLLLTIGYVAVLFALNRSGQSGAGWIAVLTAGFGVVLLAGYTRHALTTSATPALDLRLLRRPGFAASLAVMALVGLIMYSQLTSLPIFGADRHHLHGFEQGLLVSALGLGLLVSMSSAGRISDRTGPRPLVRSGALVTAVGLGIFALAHDSLPLPALFALFVGLGLSFGCTASPTFASVYRTLPSAEQSQGTTSLFMTVQLTASLGVTILGLLQARSPEHWLTALFLLLTAAALAMAGLSRALPSGSGARTAE
jgi:EmrB/QacA subfamily drug resistance transporter